MKLKLDANGNAVLQDGMPVYVHSDGKEVPFDAAGTVATISRLNGEAKSHRERYQTAEEKLKLFEGIEDPKKAKDALRIVANLDDKKLVDAGQVEIVRQEAIKAKDEEVNLWKKKYEDKAASAQKKTVESLFGSSQYIQTKINTEAHPIGNIRKLYADHVRFDENDEPFLVDEKGKEIFSSKNPGNRADFDEAIETLISRAPNRDHMLKAPQSSGAGAQSQNGGGSPNAKTIKRADFDNKSASEKEAFFREGGAVTD